MHFWGGCDLWWVQVSHPDEGLLSGFGHDPQTLEVYRIEPVYQTLGMQVQRTGKSGRRGGYLYRAM